MRVSGTDWVEGGWTIEATFALAQKLPKHGCSSVHVSSGGVTPEQKIPLGPGYQVPFARDVRRVDMPVIAVGLITDCAG